MRINAKDPALISFIGDFLKVYLPSVRNRDPDTIDSYKNTINLYLLYLQKVFGITLMTVQSEDFNQKNIVSFMSWLKNERGNAAPTINHRLSDIRGFCKYLAKKKAITALSYEEIRENGTRSFGIRLVYFKGVCACSVVAYSVHQRIAQAHRDRSQRQG